jgi:hypothetical protein
MIASSALKKHGKRSGYSCSSKALRQSDAVMRLLDAWRLAYPKMTREWYGVGIELTVRASKKKAARACGAALKDGVWRIPPAASQEKIDSILSQFRASVWREDL